MNYWYVARPNEIFIDADNWKRSRAHTRARLQGAIEYCKLDVTNIEIHESSTNHVHIIITLRKEMDATQRAIWAIILHSDIYRACATIMRIVHSVSAADILISPKSFLRPYDDTCLCTEKHISHVMLQCPAATRLRGKWRTHGFFGKPSKGKCKWL